MGACIVTMLSVQAQADEIETGDANGVVAGEATGTAYDGECSVRISNVAAENGCEQDPGPLTWLNSARITADPAEDAVHCVVSVADPRGGFCFTVRRLRDGGIVIHTPYPGEGMAHVETKQNHPGTLFLVDDQGKPIDYTDEVPETDDDEDDA